MPVIDETTIPGGVCFDASFTLAFLSAAADRGLVSVQDDLAAELKGKYSTLAFDSRATRKLRGPALEMALIFDRVHLFGIPGDLCITELRNKSKGLVGLPLEIGRTWTETDGMFPEFIAHAKTVLKRHVLRRVNAVLRSLELGPVSQRHVTVAFDAITAATFSGIGVSKVSTLLGIALTRPLALNDPSFESRDEIIAVIKQVMGLGHCNVYEATFTLLLTTKHLLTIWELLLFSEGSESPFVAKDFVFPTAPTDRFGHSTHSTFTLCQIAMNEEIGYAPLVSSIDDVLKLRGHKAINRFREQLKIWTDVLPEGNEKSILTIKKDVRLANRELKKLSKWKKVDTWVYWMALPTALIPVISTLVTITGFATHGWIERQETRHGWVGIGR